MTDQTTYYQDATQQQVPARQAATPASPQSGNPDEARDEFQQGMKHINRAAEEMGQTINGVDVEPDGSKITINFTPPPEQVQDAPVASVQGGPDQKSMDQLNALAEGGVLQQDQARQAASQLRQHNSEIEIPSQLTSPAQDLQAPLPDTPPQDRGLSEKDPALGSTFVGMYAQQQQPPRQRAAQRELYNDRDSNVAGSWEERVAEQTQREQAQNAERGGIQR